MKIERTHIGIKIKLPKYKINIKKLKTRGNHYQYSSSLPPLLCSFFNIINNKEDPNYNKNSLLFYEKQGTNYICTLKSYDKAVYLDMIKHEIDLYKNSPVNVDPDLLQEAEENPVNRELLKSVSIPYGAFSKVYNLHGNTYRVTLPSMIFKNLVDVEKDNYILFSINTMESDLLMKKGVISYEVIQQE